MGIKYSIIRQKRCTCSNNLKNLQRRRRYGVMLSTLRKPEFLKLYSIPLISVSIGSMSNSIAILYALDLGASILQVNLISTVRSTMAILLFIPFGILSDRYGRKPMILYPRAIMFIGTLIRVFAKSPRFVEF